MTKILFASFIFALVTAIGNAEDLKQASVSAIDMNYSEQFCIEGIKKAEPCKSTPSSTACRRLINECRTGESFSTKVCEGVVKDYREATGKFGDGECPTSITNKSTIGSCSEYITKCGKLLQNSAAIIQQSGLQNSGVDRDCLDLALSRNKDELKTARDKFEKEVKDQMKELNNLQEERIKADEANAKAIQSLVKQENEAEKSYRESKNKVYELRKRNDEKSKAFIDAVQEFDTQRVKLVLEKQKLESQIVKIKNSAQLEIAKLKTSCKLRARDQADAFEAKRMETLKDSTSGVRADGSLQALADTDARGTRKKRIERKRAFFEAQCILDQQEIQLTIEENKRAALEDIENQKKAFDELATELRTKLDNMAKKLDIDSATDHEQTMYNFTEEGKDYLTALNSVMQAKISSAQQKQQMDALFDQRRLQAEALKNQAEQNLAMIPDLANVDKEAFKDFDELRKDFGKMTGVLTAGYSQCCTKSVADDTTGDYFQFCKDALQGQKDFKKGTASGSRTTVPKNPGYNWSRPSTGR